MYTKNKLFFILAIIFGVSLETVSEQLEGFLSQNWQISDISLISVLNFDYAYHILPYISGFSFSK